MPDIIMEAILGTASALCTAIDYIQITYRKLKNPSYSEEPDKEITVHNDEYFGPSLDSIVSEHIKNMQQKDRELGGTFEEHNPNYFKKY